MDDSKIYIHQRLDEIYHILCKMVEKKGDELGVAYNIVTEVNDNPEVLPSWTIRIDDSKTVLTSDILLHYMSKQRELKDALVCFMCDHFPYYGSR